MSWIPSYQCFIKVISVFSGIEPCQKVNFFMLGSAKLCIYYNARLMIAYPWIIQSDFLLDQCLLLNKLVKSTFHLVSFLVVHANIDI